VSVSLSPLVVAVSTITRGRGIEHRTVRAWVLLSPSVPVSRLHYWGRIEHAVCVSLHSRSSGLSLCGPYMLALYTENWDRFRCPCEEHCFLPEREIAFARDFGPGNECPLSVSLK